MPFDAFKEKVEDPTTEQHKRLLDFAKGKIKKSRAKMSPSYPRWDYADAIFRSRRHIDKEDRSAIAKGNTAKMVVPLTFSQVMTFVAFGCMTLQQNDRFYNLQATGTKNNPLRESMELVLQMDVLQNQWNTFLVQFFLDIGKFSLGCAEVCYEEQIRMMRVPVTKQEMGPMGIPTSTTTNDFQPIPVFVGNKVHSLSPYRFYPDADMPLSRYQEGSYCGSEDVFDYGVLSADSNLFNLDKIPKMTKTMIEERKSISRVGNEFPIRTNENMGGQQSSMDKSDYVTSGGVIVTKLVVDVIPSKFKIGNDDSSPLGDEDFPVRYIIWYANDQTVIRFEEAYYLHGMFPYIAAQYLPDQHQHITESLADVCEQITEYITWLANTHKASQANSVESKWAIDPSGVDIKTIESRSPYMFLKKNAAHTDVRRYITQFQTTDTTMNAPAEIAQFKELLENVTGYSGFMQGQSSAGRRSATQDKVVTQGAAARGKTTLSCIWDQAFAPLGKQFIANNRQEMDLDTFTQIVGDQPTEMVNPVTGVPYTTQDLFSLFSADPITIATAKDFFVFDGSLPSEKAFLAQSLQEILMEMMSNPQIAMIMGYGPADLRSLFENIYTLRGVPTSMLPAPVPVPPQQPGAPPNLSVLPPPGGPPQGSPAGVPAESMS